MEKLLQLWIDALSEKILQHVPLLVGDCLHEDVSCTKSQKGVYVNIVSLSDAIDATDGLFDSDL